MDALLVTKPEHVRYLTGFTGSAGAVLLGPRRTLLITDGRYAVQAAREAAGAAVRILRRGETLADRVGREAARWGIRRLGFEPAALSVAAYRELRRRLGGVRLAGVRNGVDLLRRVKSAQEIRRISQAAARAERAFRAVKERIRPGAVEAEIALALEAAMRREGAARPAFDLIVAAGPRSAMPHAKASGRRLRRGDLVVVDFGAEAGGYFSDMTRTVYLGRRPRGWRRRILETVLRAQEAALAAVRPGVPLADVDRAAREVIRRAGFGRYFGHGTGHGIGLEVHEAPSVTPASTARAEPGMVFTVEPGIYLPGRGGVRIEDMVLVTSRGCRRLTRLPRRAWD